MQEFQAKQELKMRVPNESIPVEEYLKEPRWLISAITEADRIETLGEDHFRLKLREKKFMQLKFEPQADLKVWTDEAGTLHIRSTDCEVIGLESLQESFNMELSGELSPVNKGETTWLQGTAQIRVSFELPAAIKMIPKAVLKPTGNAFLKGILGTMKGRVRKQLVRNYQSWVEAKESEQPTPAASNS